MTYSFLLELLCEEMPVSEQGKSATYLAETLQYELKILGVHAIIDTVYYGPRRLTVLLKDLPFETKAVQEEKKGPKVGAPDKAIAGFAKGCNLTQKDLVIKETEKGQFYFANIHKKSEAITTLLSHLIPSLLKRFPFKKAMRWGDYSLQWTRPLRNILAILYKGEESHLVPFTLEGISSNTLTYGHHFMQNEALSIRHFQEYETKLEAAFVIANPKKREAFILAEMNKILAEKEISLVPDKALLKEVVGLVEYPVILLGEISEEFHSLPSEVLQTSMREHQKFFSVTDNKTNKVTHFITISNVKTKDQNKKILDGNQRVLKARLRDADYFYQTDQQASPDFFLEKLKKVSFYPKLGSQYDRSERIAGIAHKIAASLGASADMAFTAGKFCKMDLVSQMVGEFPELQGIMGGYYMQSHADPQIALAIRDHYKPLGLKDDLPKTRLGTLLSISDKIDQITAFWSIKEYPTSSKDPFALRRAALGIITLLLENKLDLSIQSLLDMTDYSIDTKHLLSFFQDRLTIYLKGQDMPHTLLEAVLDPSLSVYNIYQKSVTLKAFLDKPEGQDLLALYKRAMNIIPADITLPAVQEASFETQEEKDLWDSVQKAKGVFQEHLEKKDYHAALTSLLSLKNPLFSFLDHVTIHAEAISLKENRLSLLQNIHTIILNFSNFSKL